MENKIDDKEIRRLKFLEEHPEYALSDKSYLSRRKEYFRVQQDKRALSSAKKLGKQLWSRKLREEQMERYFTLYDEFGLDQAEIGRLEYRTRQAISLCLTKHPKWKEIKGKNSKSGRHRGPLQEKICNQCGKIIVRSQGVKLPRFCSKLCSYRSYGREVPIFQLPIQDYRKFNAEKTNKYYHEKLKFLPDFHDRIRRYNLRAKEKGTYQTWYKKNKDSIRYRFLEKMKDPVYREKHNKKAAESQRKKMRKMMDSMTPEDRKKYWKEKYRNKTEKQRENIRIRNREYYARNKEKYRLLYQQKKLSTPSNPTN